MRFVITMTPDRLAAAEREGMHKYVMFCCNKDISFCTGDASSSFIYSISYHCDRDFSVSLIVHATMLPLQGLQDPHDNQYVVDGVV